MDAGLRDAQWTSQGGGEVFRAIVHLNGEAKA